MEFMPNGNWLFWDVAHKGLRFDKGLDFCFLPSRFRPGKRIYIHSCHVPNMFSTGLWLMLSSLITSPMLFSPSLTMMVTASWAIRYNGLAKPLLSCECAGVCECDEAASYEGFREAEGHGHLQVALYWLKFQPTNLFRIFSSLLKCSADCKPAIIGGSKRTE